MQAQCAIDFDFGESTFGVSPDPNLGETFVTGVLDQPYSDVLHILIPTSAADIDDQFPPTLPIDSVVVAENGVVLTDTVTNETFLPEEIGLGLVYNNNGDSGNEASFLGGQQYCAAIQGTPNRAGIYRISIDVLGWATIFTPFNAPYTFDNFTLRINCPLVEDVEVTPANSLDGTNGSLTVILAEGVEATSIAWFNEFGVQIGSEATVTVDNPGTFSVQVTTDDCDSVFEGYVVIDVGVDCFMTAEAVVVPAGIGAMDGSATVNVENANGEVQVSWFNEAGLLVGTSSTVEGLGAGIYSVLIEDELGCVVELFDVVVEEVDSVGDNALTHVVAFPNPSSKVLFIDGVPSNASLTLTGMNGQLVWQGVVAGGRGVDVSGLPEGFYMLGVQTAQAQRTLRVVVAR